MTPYILPKALPDETLYSLVSRIAWLNGVPSDRLACELLLGDLGVPRVSDAIVDLVHFCTATEYAYGKPDDVLGSLTIWPFFRNMATHQSVEVPRAESPDDRRRVTLLDLGLAGLSNMQPHIWRWCSACISRDIEEYGLAYWHRTHQLPGVVICPLHGLSLNEAHIPYWARQKCFLAPESVQAGFESIISCSGDHWAGVALEIAGFAKNALDGGSGEVTPAIIQGAFSDGLRAMNLIDGKTHMHAHRFVSRFLDHYGELTHINQFSPFLNAKALFRLAKAMGTSSMVLPPTLGLMIANWVFGSWELFHASCDWRMTIDTPFTLGHQSSDQTVFSANTREQNRKEHRRICVKFLAAVPIASRSDLWHAHPKSCRWLTQYDRDWFDSTLPTAKMYAPRQLKLF
jgi:hypothetical protein